MTKKLSIIRFVLAWLFALSMAILPTVLLIFPLAFIIEMLFALLLGVILLGIPTSVVLEALQYRKRSTFVICGAVAGQILVPVLIIVFDNQLSSILGERMITMATTLALFFGGLYGSLVAYCYHMMAYPSAKEKQ